MNTIMKVNQKLEDLIKKISNYYYSHSIFHKIGILIISALIVNILATIFLLPVYNAGKEFGAWLSHNFW